MPGAQAGAPAPSDAVPLRIAQAQNFEQELWERVRDSGDAVLLETYIRSFPTGAHVPEAYEKIQQLRAAAGATGEGGRSPGPDDGVKGGPSSGSKSAAQPSREAATAKGEPTPAYRPGESGWIGIELRETALEGQQKAAAGQERGVSIVSVLSYGRGAEAGLVPGDIILALDGAAVGPVPDLVTAVSSRKPGTRVTLGLLRASGRQDVSFTLGGRITDIFRAAEAGNADAQLQAGYMHATGEGVEKDEVEARRWYLASAAQNNAIAQYNLGNIYREGRGVPKDEAVAADWNRRSAELGYSLAQTRLGYNYVNGITVAKNPVLGVEWYRKAAAQKEPYALNNLGMMYADGLGGLAKNRTRAIELLREAAALGNDLAINNLNNMKVPVYDPAQIQGALADLGFDPGPVDGKMGPQTRRAISAFQQRAGLPVNGEGSLELLARLREAKQAGVIAGAASAAVPARPSPGGGALGDLDTLD